MSFASSASSSCLLVLSLLVACGGKSAPVQDNAAPASSSSSPPSSSAPPSTPPPGVVGGSPPPSTDPGFPTSPCGDPGTGLAGTSYDITRSRFAFGSAPTQQTMNGMTRWTGADGVVSIGAFGAAMGSMNGGAPETALPDWSEDVDMLTAHVRDYWIAMGVPTCQILGTQVTAAVGSGGFHQRTILLERALDAIPIVESRAFARFNSADQSTDEGFLFPAIPPDVVSSARTFRDQLATPAGLAAFKAKLPADSQGTGGLVIHHSAVSLMPNTPFESAATWEVTVNGVTRNYDANGAAVTTLW
jgi:hypothetical protein